MRYKFQGRREHDGRKKRSFVVIRAAVDLVAGKIHLFKTFDRQNNKVSSFRMDILNNLSSGSVSCGFRRISRLLKKILDVDVYYQLVIHRIKSAA
jgi:hypothetical protein